MRPLLIISARIQYAVPCKKWGTLIRNIWCYLKVLVGYLQVICYSKIFCSILNLASTIFIFFHQMIVLKVGLSFSKKTILICFNDSPSKMMKNAFYFMLKALFVLKIFKFLWHVEKRLDQKDKVHFETYDVTAWLTENHNTHIAQYLTNYRQPDNEIW